MAIYEFEGKRPKIDKTAYVFPSADVIGSVVIGRQCFIAPGARLRGDYGQIIIGDKTSIQDNVVIHALDGGETRIGQYVQVAHGAKLHNCEVGDFAIVGIGVELNDYVKVGEWAIVASGTTVPPKKIIEPNTIVFWNYATKGLEVLRDVTDDDKKYWLKYKEEYAQLAYPRYPKGLKKIR